MGDVAGPSGVSQGAAKSTRGRSGGSGAKPNRGKSGVEKRKGPARGTVAEPIDTANAFHLLAMAGITEETPEGAVAEEIATVTGEEMELQMAPEQSE